MIEHVFGDRDAASSAVAARIESALRRQLAKQADVAFVVSGGTSPAAVFAELSGKKLDWHRIQVLLSDERWVPSTHDDSNEKMLREKLIRSYASRLRLLPSYAADASIEDRCAVMERAIRELPLPFACTLLGMGEDGHFASLFPGLDNLRDGLDPNSHRLCIPAKMTGNAVDRISLTLAALAMSEEILLLAFGRHKRAVIDQAVGRKTDLPVSKLFAQRVAPVHVFWAP